MLRIHQSELFFICAWFNQVSLELPLLLLVERRREVIMEWRVSYQTILSSEGEREKKREEFGMLMELLSTFTQS